MIASTLGLSRINKFSIKQMEVNFKKINTQKPQQKHQLRGILFTSRESQYKQQESSIKQCNTLSAREKYLMLPGKNEFGLTSNFLKQRKTNVTEFSSEKVTSNTSLSRSSKRKRTQTNLFNFSVPKMNKQHHFKDSYLHNFISNNSSSFISKKSQNKPQISKQSNIESLNKSFIRSTKYEKIRSTMKKLKNLTQNKSYKRKSSQLNTTQQEWNEIEKIVRLACQQKIKRINTEQTIDTNKTQTPNETYKEQAVKFQNISPKELSSQSENLQPVLLSKTTTPFQSIQNEQQKAQVKFMILQKPQNQGLNCIEDLESKQYKELNSQKQSKEKQLQFSEFYSLLLIFQHTLYTVPQIIDKVVSVCQQYKIQIKSSIYLFVKHLFLHKKLIESVMIKFEDSVFRQQHTYDYTEVVQQIKHCNRKNLRLLQKLKQNIDTQKPSKVSSQSLKLPGDDQTLESLSQNIKQLQKDFLLSNMKVIKKLLKNISKSPKTNIKQFHIFLNYSTCFLNLFRVQKNIQKVLQKTLRVQSINGYKIKNVQQAEQEKQEKIIRQFLYKECKFIQNKYLHTKEKLFEIYFEIDDEHKRIEDYYHLIIKQLKSIEIQNKQNTQNTQNT